MANPLDELSGPTHAEGRDINVIDKQLPVTIGAGSKLFEIILSALIGVGAVLFIVFMILGSVPAVAKGAGWKYYVAGVVLLLLIIPGIVYWIKSIQARNYFRGLQQKIQHDASQIDNYLEQRVVVLKNCAGILAKAIDLDKDTMKSVAALRAGRNPEADAERNEVGRDIAHVDRLINMTLENYPELKAHAEIQDAMQQNSYLQKEVTAAREVYNDTVQQWNHDIFQWPVKKIAAAKLGYTSRIPFTTTREVKEAARQNFFGDNGAKA